MWISIQRPFYIPVQNAGFKTTRPNFCWGFEPHETLKCLAETQDRADCVTCQTAGAPVAKGRMSRSWCRTLFTLKWSIHLAHKLPGCWFCCLSCHYQDKCFVPLVLYRAVGTSGAILKRANDDGKNSNDKKRSLRN